MKLVDLDYIRDVTDILMMVAMLAMIIATSVAIYRSFDQEVKVLNQNNDKSSGLLTLGIFNVKEEYQSLKMAFKEIISDLEKIKSVAIDGIIFEIEWSLGGDLKWLATVQGINSANSNQPCLWCMWHKNDISEKKWCNC